MAPPEPPSPIVKAGTPYCSMKCSFSIIIASPWSAALQCWLLTSSVEMAKAKGGRVGLLVTETPANPTNSLVDLALWREASEWLGAQQGGARH